MQNFNSYQLSALAKRKRLRSRQRLLKRYTVKLVRGTSTRITNYTHQENIMVCQRSVSDRTQPPVQAVDVNYARVEAPKFYLWGINYELRITNYELYSLHLVPFSPKHSCISCCGQIGYHKHSLEKSVEKYEKSSYLVDKKQRVDSVLQSPQL